MAFAHINGIVLHHELLGDPDAKNILVFSNSLGTDFRIWLPVFDELDEDVAILVYDKRGHGLSGAGEAPYAIEDHVNDLIGLVEELGLQKAVYCGLSVGGLIVQGLYARRPDLVKALILCDTAVKIGSDEMWNSRISDASKNGIASISTSILQRWFTKEFHEARATDLEGYRVMLERQSVVGYTGTCAAIRDADFTTDAAKIKVPVLCIVGDQDGSTPPALVKATADMIPGSTFEVISNCGHIPCVERPEALAASIGKFMKRVGKGK